jgi:hypothetical protein
MFLIKSKTKKKLQLVSTKKYENYFGCSMTFSRELRLPVDNNLLSYLFFSQDVWFLNLNDFIFLKNINFLKKI